MNRFVDKERSDGVPTSATDGITPVLTPLTSLSPVKVLRGYVPLRQTSYGSERPYGRLSARDTL